MVSANDPVESFFNSLEAVKGVFSPLELGIRKAAKDFEHCFPGKNGDKIRFEEIRAKSNAGNKNWGVKVQSLKKNISNDCVVGDEKKKGLSFRVPVKTFLGIFSPNCGSDNHKEGVNGGDSCSNCLQFAVTWSMLFNGFVQALPIPFKNNKKCFPKNGNVDKACIHSGVQVSKSKPLGEIKQSGSNGRCVVMFQNDDTKEKIENDLSIECFIGFLCEQLTQNLQKFDLGIQENKCKSIDPPLSAPANQGNHFSALANIFENTKAHGNGFLGNLNLKFARVGGVPSNIVGVDSVQEEGDDGASNKEENEGNSPQKVSNGILSIPLSNVERLRSTLSTVSFNELIELLVPNLIRSSNEHPDKKKLFSVQDFFRYTEAEGRRFFEELDRDGDGQVTMEDLEMAMRKRKLPHKYAREFMGRTKSHLFSKSFGWKQFLNLMEQKEPTILRAYTTLCLNKSGTLQKSEILASLKNAGLPANEDNAVAMMRFLKADSEESISYGHFRNFMLLLPSDRLQEDPRSIWFEAATVVVVPPPVELPASSVLKAALVGGLSCALSCSLLHPVDTVKTRVQASTLTFPEILAKLPQIGVRGLYRGSIPAIIGQFSSHGLRTGIFEASKLVLVKVAPTVPDIQVQSVASFCSTVLGTAVRIPCEVLKQRLQAGLFDNVGEAIIGTWNQDGLKGFFRGTGATLFREVPFYVAGMGLYAESKKVVQRILGRELEPWETITVGALSGGLTAVITTPFDVMKTRMMTAPGGRSLPMTLVAMSILRQEGPLGLFKGAVPRFFWIMPLGAMNFAGYELAKKAMEKNEEVASS